MSCEYLVSIKIFYLCTYVDTILDVFLINLAWRCLCKASRLTKQEYQCCRSCDHPWRGISFLGEYLKWDEKFFQEFGIA